MAAAGSPAIPVTIALGPSKYFLTDVAISATLNGTPIYRGGFLTGFEVTVPLMPGPHGLAMQIMMGIVTRTRNYQFHIQPGAAAYRIDLAYSRIWGNFTRKLRLSSSPAH